MREIDLKSFEDDLDEEVDIYSINNSLDDATTNELRFIINSFSKYYKKTVSKSPKKNFLSIINNFDITLETISTGIMGTSFKTNASQLYKNLPTIKELMEDSIRELEDEVETLRSINKDLTKKNKDLAIKYHDSQSELSEARTEIAFLKSSKKTSKTYNSHTSYGGCGGSMSYGRC